jgi:hypothetical protein
MGKICLGGIGIIPNRQIWETLHEELIMICFRISKFRVLRSVEKWDRRSCEVARQILTIGCEETHGSGLENLGFRGTQK